MREHPILFSGPLVRAILAGHKTQTRRIVKPQPPEDGGAIVTDVYHPTVIDQFGDEQPGAEIFGAFNLDGSWGVKCRYGQPGDQLWVREKVRCVSRSVYHWDDASEVVVEYAAGGGWTFHFDDTEPRWIGSTTPDFNAKGQPNWRPSIHMPRWASRLTLDITGVRVERLRDISEADATAEGVDWNPQAPAALNHRTAFALLWDKLNAKRAPWSSNPWVWVIEFKRVEADHAE